MEQLIQWDVQLFHVLNQWRAPWADVFMYYISESWTWIPVYIGLLVYAGWRQSWKRSLFVFVALAATVDLTDMISASLIKPEVARFRPCREEAGLTEAVFLIKGHCGGKYGFVSSHAANFFGMVTWLSLFFRQRSWTIGAFLCASLVGYSRIYLGVHYPADILGGAGLGISLGWLTTKISQRIWPPTGQS